MFSKKIAGHKLAGYYLRLLRSLVLNTGVTFAIFRGSRNIPVCRNKSKTYLEYHLTLQNKF